MGAANIMVDQSSAAGNDHTHVENMSPRVLFKLSIGKKLRRAAKAAAAACKVCGDPVPKETFLLS